MTLQATPHRMPNLRKGIYWVLMAVVLAALNLPAQAQPLRSADSQIGHAAKEREAVLAESPQMRTQQDLGKLYTWVKVAGVLLLIAVLILIERVSNLVDFNPFRNWDTNAVAARFFVMVMVGLGIALAYHWYYDADKLLPSANSIHGVDIDNLILITTLITGVAFVVTQIVLTYYVYKFRSKPGTKALFYPENHKLELIWTVIPAVGLAGMIIPGLKYWDDYSYPPDNPQAVNIRVVAEQFRWNLQYPGADAEFGRYDFRQISGENNLGIDSLDANGKDDFSTDTLRIPVGRQINFNLRSKDVLHGFYLPHFRVNVYAIPGMPVSVSMTARMTTEEARREYGNPNFDFELACTQICGSSHYNMRKVLVVMPSVQYDAWYAAQVAKRSAELNPAAAAPDGQNAQPTDTAAVDTAAAIMANADTVARAANNAANN